MRLIDADALIAEYPDDVLTHCDIEAAPTIDLESLQPQWIPVEERQPEHYRNEDGTLIPFIVCVRNCKKPVVAYYDGEIWGDLGRMDVIAWAPTPEPYKEDEHD